MPFGQRERSARSSASSSDALIFVDAAISASDLPRRSRSLFSRAQNVLRESEASTDVMTWILRESNSRSNRELPDCEQILLRCAGSRRSFHDTAGKKIQQ